MTINRKHLQALLFNLIITISSILFGCSDGGYDRQGGGGSGGEYGGGNGTPQCLAVPLWWDLRGYAGCEASPHLTALYRGNDRHEQFAPGQLLQNVDQSDTAFYSQNVWSVYLTKPDNEDCGPIKVAMVSNSGTFDLRVSAPVDFFILNTDKVNLVWMKIHGGISPDNEDYSSPEFGQLLVDLYECEIEVGESCQLRKNFPALSLPSNIVTPYKTGKQAIMNGAFCGRTLILGRAL